MIINNPTLILLHFFYYFCHQHRNSHMHNPSKRSSKNKTSQQNSLTSLLIARQCIESIRKPESKYPSHQRAFLSRQKISNKVDEIAPQNNFLKINGKQISSLITFEHKKGKNKVSTNQKISESLNHSQKKILEKAEQHQDQKQHQTLQINKQDEKYVKQNEGCLLPQINSRDNRNINQTSIKKSYGIKKSERQITGITKSIMRRQTLAQANISNRLTKNQQNGKAKMQHKKIANFLQYRQFLLTITLSNRILVLPGQQAVYKAYICKGNNGLLVKSIIKTRPWWVFKPLSDIDSCNLVWTEWKRNKSINQLDTWKQIVNQKYQNNIQDNNNKIKNKQARQISLKKHNNFIKVTSGITQLNKQYDNSPLNQNYLKITNKINSKSFDQVAEKHFDTKIQRFYQKSQRKILNHVPGGLCLHSKKLLFLSMSKYYQKLGKDVFSVIPLTFHITKGVNDPQFQKFTKYYDEIGKKGKIKGNIWICKPGQNSNRGHGIQVLSLLGDIKNLINERVGPSRTLIIQKYMQTPFLYNKRKFDLRCYILITCVNGYIKGYWYEQGYVRTTSIQYTLKNLQNKLIHLTNDAVQKKGQQYGKFQGFNKVSMGQLQRYIQSTTQYKFKPVYDKIKEIATDLIKSVGNKLNSKNKQFCFEIFGLDFMLDDKLTPYLIEANSNPCLEVDGNVLAKVIPPMIQNAIRVAIDPIFPPPYSQSFKSRFSPGSTFQTNRMQLVYDSGSKELGCSMDDEVKVAQAELAQCQQFQGELDQQ